MPDVLLTGGTGFIGSHVLEALMAAGFSVRALARPTAESTFLRAQGVEIRSGDLRDLASLCAAARGCEQVIHAAGLVSDWAPASAFEKTNVAGTLNVLESCRRESIGHVTVTGSISSYGEEDSRWVKDEQCPYRSHYPYLLHRIFPSGMNRYRDSKATATREALAFARKHQLNLTVLEPVWVYGEREFGTGFYSYLKAVQEGQRFMPGCTHNGFHVIYARDLARAYVLAAQRRLGGVERIIVGRPGADPMQRVFDLFCRAAGLNPPRRLPKGAVYPVGFALELLSTLAARPEPPLLTRGRVNMFYDSIHWTVKGSGGLVEVEQLEKGAAFGDNLGGQEFLEDSAFGAIRQKIRPGLPEGERDRPFGGRFLWRGGTDVRVEIEPDEAAKAERQVLK